MNTGPHDLSLETVTRALVEKLGPDETNRIVSLEKELISVEAAYSGNTNYDPDFELLHKLQERLEILLAETR